MTWRLQTRPENNAYCSTARCGTTRSIHMPISGQISLGGGVHDDDASFASRLSEAPQQMGKIKRYLYSIWKRLSLPWPIKESPWLLSLYIISYLTKPGLVISSTLIFLSLPVAIICSEWSGTSYRKEGLKENRVRPVFCFILFFLSMVCAYNLVMMTEYIVWRCEYQRDTALLPTPAEQETLCLFWHTVHILRPIFTGKTLFVCENQESGFFGSYSSMHRFRSEQYGKTECFMYVLVVLGFHTFFSISVRASDHRKVFFSSACFFLKRIYCKGRVSRYSSLREKTSSDLNEEILEVPIWKKKKSWSS